MPLKQIVLPDAAPRTLPAVVSIVPPAPPLLPAASMRENDPPANKPAALKPPINTRRFMSGCFVIRAFCPVPDFLKAMRLPLFPATSPDLGKVPDDPSHFHI